MTAGTGSDRSFSLGYRPELDGLRAIAVLGVMTAHMEDFPVLPGGGIGVDIFLVLSGFLITTLLLAEHRTTGTIRLRDFYLRRALRLFPALACLLLALLSIAALSRFAHLPGFSPEKTAELWHAIPFTAFYVANWIKALHLADLGPLAHTWSLSLEEQFYIVWPVTLIVLLRRRMARAHIVAGLLVLSVIVGIERYILWRADGVDRAYFGSDTRADGLLLGCSLAIVLSGPGWSKMTRTVRLNRIAGVAGGIALMLVALLFHQDDAAMWMGGYSIVAVATTAVIVGLVCAPTSRAHRVLSWTPLVAIGRISYGLYLWHYPIFRQLRGNSPIEWLAEAIIALGIAACSFVIIERPALRLKSRFRHNAAAAPIPRPELPRTAQPAD